MRPDLVVFDLDGTLVDSAADIRNALNLALASEGLPGLALEAVRLMIGRGPRVLLQRALAHLGEAADADRVATLTAAFRQHYTEQGHSLSRLLPGAVDCLGALAQQGIPAAVCSNKPTPNCLQVLEELRIAQHFAAIQGSGDGLPLKPDPAPLNAIIDRLGVRRDGTLYVGDSETDIATARSAAVPVAIVKGGYSAASADSMAADWTIDSLADVTAIWERTGS